MTEIQRLVKIKILKEILKEYELLAKYNDNGTDYDRYCALDMAIKELEQKPRFIVKADGTIEQIKNCEDCDYKKWLKDEIEPKWIPVSERLPEENGYYLTTTMYHEVYCDYWEEESFNRTEAVIAWMPLPEPYKAESEE